MLSKTLLFLLALPVAFGQGPDAPREDNDVDQHGPLTPSTPDSLASGLVDGFVDYAEDAGPQTSTPVTERDVDAKKPKKKKKKHSKNSSSKTPAKGSNASLINSITKLVEGLVKSVTGLVKGVKDSVDGNSDGSDSDDRAVHHPHARRGHSDSATSTASASAASSTKAATVDNLHHLVVDLTSLSRLVEGLADDLASNGSTKRDVSAMAGHGDTIKSISSLIKNLVDGLAKFVSRIKPAKPQTSTSEVIDGLSSLVKDIITGLTKLTQTVQQGQSDKRDVNGNGPSDSVSTSTVSTVDSFHSLVNDLNSLSDLVNTLVSNVTTRDVSALAGDGDTIKSISNLIKDLVEGLGNFVSRIKPAKPQTSTKEVIDGLNSLVKGVIAGLTKLSQGVQQSQSNKRDVDSNRPSDPVSTSTVSTVDSFHSLVNDLNSLSKLVNDLASNGTKRDVSSIAGHQDIIKPISNLITALVNGLDSFVSRIKPAKPQTSTKEVIDGLNSLVKGVIAGLTKLTSSVQQGQSDKRDVDSHRPTDSVSTETVSTVDSFHSLLNGLNSLSELANDLASSGNKRDVSSIAGDSDTIKSISNLVKDLVEGLGNFVSRIKPAKPQTSTKEVIDGLSNLVKGIITGLTKLTQTVQQGQSNKRDVDGNGPSDSVSTETVSTVDNFHSLVDDLNSLTGLVNGLADDLARRPPGSHATKRGVDTSSSTASRDGDLDHLKEQLEELSRIGDDLGGGDDPQEPEEDPPEEEPEDPTEEEPEDPTEEEPEDPTEEEPEEDPTEDPEDPTEDPEDPEEEDGGDDDGGDGDDSDDDSRRQLPDVPSHKPDIMPRHDVHHSTKLRRQPDGPVENLGEPRLADSEAEQQNPEIPSKTTRKPTHKPTHKPSKTTHRPTHRPTNHHGPPNGWGPHGGWGGHGGHHWPPHFGQRNPERGVNDDGRGNNKVDDSGGNNGDDGSDGPSHTQRNVNDFTLTQVPNVRFERPNGLQAFLRVFYKYNKPLPPALLQAISLNPGAVTAGLKLPAGVPTGLPTAPTGLPGSAPPTGVTPPKIGKRTHAGIERRGLTGTAAAVDPSGWEVEFVIPVKIGTPPQTVNLVADTGSADLWVFSTDTFPKQVNGQVLYNPQKSTTSKRVGGNSQWRIAYGDGSSASGITYTDVVSVGGVSVGTQYVESATNVSASFSENPLVSGLIGLGMSGGNGVRPGPQKTFMDNVKGGLSSPLFAANLKHAEVGCYDFGFINNASFTGPLAYVPVSRSSSYWTINIDGSQVGPDPKSYLAAPFSAIVDTGTTLLLLPDSVTNNYWSKVPGAKFDPNWGAVLFPCSAVLPDFYLGLGTYRGLVPGGLINYGHVDNTRCFGGLQSSTGLGINIVGDTALKAQYVVFDYGNGGRVGFANKNVKLSS